MGTRSIVRVFVGETEVACIYRQYDGYPSGMGADLKSWLGNVRVVNGAMSDDGPDIVNQGGRVATRLIHRMAEAGRNPCLVDPSVKDHGQDFEYYVACPTWQACDEAERKGVRGVPVKLTGFIAGTPLRQLPDVDQDLPGEE